MDDVDLVHLETTIITTTMHIIGIISITVVVSSVVILEIANVTMRFCNSDPNSDSDAFVDDMCKTLAMSTKKTRHVKVTVAACG